MTQHVLSRFPADDPACRRMRALVVVAAGLLPAATPHAAETWPAKPIRLIVPAAPGGAIDIVARLAGERLSASLGKPVIVDNRAGADGAIGLDIAAKAAPDGHTLVGITDALTVISFVQPNLSFDPQTSFAPITIAVTQPRVLSVHPSLPATSFRDFVVLAKARPGTIAYASGTPAHRLTAELMKRMAGIDLTHVPYKGGAPAVADVTAGHVPSAVTGLSPVLPQARAGKLRMLAVTSRTRSTMVPEVPTLDESGLRGYDVYEWIALLAPARTPPDVVTRLNSELGEAFRQPALRSKLEAASLETRPTSQREAESVIRTDHARWAKVIRELGLRLDAQ